MFYIVFYRKMKKFSFLLVGVFLLWTITFALAQEAANPEAATWATAEEISLVSAQPESAETTADTTEVAQPEATEVASEETAAPEATEVTTWNEIEVAETTAETADAETVEDNSIKISDAAKEKYSEEQIAAYEWAFNNGITTINDIEKAKLSGWLTRAQLAKMMSQYLTNVLWQTPATTEEKANYSDVDESLGDLADFIEVAYAYKIMWVKWDGTPLAKFNPKGQVTRAEYATVFSRVLFGDKYNKSEWNYYEDHIKALKKVGILTNDNASIKEVRGWVMLMMYRSVNVDLTIADEEPSQEVISIANPASEYCVAQWWELNIVADEEGNQSGICKLADGTEVEEWEYYRANHQEEIEAATWDTVTAPLYTEEDLKSAEKVIMEEGFGKLNVKVENVNLKYMGDEKANLELKYCQELDSTVEECIVFESDFYIPEQDAQMAWAFEPNTTLTGYQWYLGRTKGGEWKVLTFGY